MSNDVPFPYEITVEVTFRDLDVLGHVNHAVFLTYMETARTRFFVELFELDGPHALPVILAEATCSYKSPAFFGELLRVGLGVSRFGGKSFDLVYQIVAEGDGRLVATGKTVMVMYDYEGGRAMALTDAAKERLVTYWVELPSK